MRKRCIVIFPDSDNLDEAQKVRSKYDPLANHVRPHITLVFPFESDINASVLRMHLEKCIGSISPFRIKLNGIGVNKAQAEHWIFIKVEEGSKEISKIQEILYTDILKTYRPEWLKNGEYNPHMTIGRTKSRKECNLAVNGIKSLSLGFETIVKKISVELIEKNEDSVIEMEVNL